MFYINFSKAIRFIATARVHDTIYSLCIPENYYLDQCFHVMHFRSEILEYATRYQRTSHERGTTH